MLLSVMMVYKYWDNITKEDLKFSVGSKQAIWEVKDPLLMQLTGAMSDYPKDNVSNYHGGTPASLIGGLSGQQFYNQGLSQSKVAQMGIGYGAGGGGEGRVSPIRWTILD
jgi:hypothetical protein